jgi:hypothetical protein
MNAKKLQDRGKSLAEKTLAAVESVERRILEGESGAAISSAIEQLRGAVESLETLQTAAVMEAQTQQLTSHLDERVRAMEQLVTRAIDRIA